MRDVVIVDSIRTGLAKSHRGTFNLTRLAARAAGLNAVCRYHTK